MTQAQYFSLNAKYFLEEHSYQRVGANTVRVEIPVDSLYDCNYMMFQNTSYSDKWFYAFITDVAYINNAVSEITYEIDVMQTWLPTRDYDLGNWFIVREHSVNDNYFDNTQPEDLELGDSLEKQMVNEYDMNDLCFCMLISKYSDGHLPVPEIKNNIVTALGFVPSPNNTLVVLEDLINAGYEDAIVAAYMCPVKFTQTNQPDPETQGYYRSDMVETVVDLVNIHGYQPNNRKLFTYPYCYLYVSNNNGETTNYKLENFDNHAVVDGYDHLTFFANGSCMPTVNALLYPQNYLGISHNRDEGLTLNNFPTCAIAGDTFKAWWAQNKGSVISSGINSVLGSLFSGGVNFTRSNINHEYGAATYSGGNMTTFGGAYSTIARATSKRLGVGAISAAVDAVGQVGNYLGKKRDLEHTPPNVHGQITSEALNAGSRRYKFSIYKATIKREYAQIIDAYFTMYGYASNRVGVPNINSRPHWNYIKTSGAYVFGDMPQDAAKAIASIYDKGITFWKRGSEVGHYELDNRPT